MKHKKRLESQGAQIKVDLVFPLDKLRKLNPVLPLILFMATLLFLGCATTPEVTNATKFNKRGIAYAKTGHYDQAISDFNRALELNPKDVKAYYNRGLAYYQKGEYDQAISDFNKALEINPIDAKAYYIRGLAYYQKGEYDQAISDYTKALELNPRYAKAYYNRGLACYEKGQYDQTISGLNEQIDKLEQEKKTIKDEKQVLAEKLAKLQLEYETLSSKHESEEDMEKLKVKVLSGDGDLSSAKEMAKKLRNMGYKITSIHYAPRSNFSRNTVYFAANFQNEARRLLLSLGGSATSKPITWSSIFDLIVVTGKSP